MDFNNIEEYNKELAARVEKLKKGEPLQRAVFISNDEVIQRIYIKGQGTKGLIGHYDTTRELYVNPDKAPVKFARKGKFGETKFLNGKSHKTGWFPHYKAFRTKQGRPTDKVILNLTGLLFLDHSNGLIKVSVKEWTAGVKNPNNALKMAGNEKRFKQKISSLSTKERKRFLKNLTKFTIELLT